MLLVLVFASVIAAVACSKGNATDSSALVADLRVDTNRDGVVDVTGTTDVEGKAQWTSTRGAIMLPNIGDSTNRCPKSGDLSQSDAQLEQCHDAVDDVQRAPQYLAPMRTMPQPNATLSSVGQIEVVGTSAAKVRVFIKRAGNWVILRAADRLSRDELLAGAELGVDARDFVRDTAVWDGHVTVHFKLSDGQLTSTDEVKLRVAPVLTYNHQQAAAKVFVPSRGLPEHPANAAFVSALSEALSESGLNADAVTKLNTIDTWAQDFVEFGYVSMPKPNGAMEVLRIAIRSSQPGRVAGRALFDLRGPGTGVVQIGGAGYHQTDSFGNLETVPPYEWNGKKYRAGRIIYGDSGDGIAPHKDWRTFFASQQDQAPIVLDTSWLRIGHVDEFVQFVPANTPRGWKIAIDDPESGLRILKAAQNSGYGRVRAVSHPGAPQMTINELLADAEFLKSNAEAAAAIKKNLDILIRETGVTDAEIIRIPGMYKTGRANPPGSMASDIPGDTRITYGPGRLSAFFPAAINGIVVNAQSYIAPKQWGPVVNGVDLLAQGVDAAYGSVGLTVRYVDDWVTHHTHFGGVHCGSNTEREIGQAWWR
jgi:protein-arginine deiminase